MIFQARETRAAVSVLAFTVPVVIGAVGNLWASRQPISLPVVTEWAEMAMRIAVISILGGGMLAGGVELGREWWRQRKDSATS